MALGWGRDDDVGWTIYIVKDSELVLVCCDEVYWGSVVLGK